MAFWESSLRSVLSPGAPATCLGSRRVSSSQRWRQVVSALAPPIMDGVGSAMIDDKPDVLEYSRPRRRRVNWHAILMVFAISLVIVTFVAAMWAAARTFQVH